MRRRHGAAAEDVTAGHNPSAECVYLDNNVWNALVERSGPLTPELLVGAFRAGAAQVVSSLALEEEIVGTATRKVAKYHQLRKLHARLVGRRSLLPLNERHVAEGLHGGVLPPGLRYNAASRLRGVRRQGLRIADVRAIADDVHELKERSQLSQTAARSSALEALAQLSMNPQHGINEWFSSVSTASWVRDLVDDSVARGLFAWNEDEVPSIERLPSAWLLNAYAMARIKRTIADNRGARPSDRYDGEHCAAGAYFDVLVTLDREFSETLSIIPDLPFTVLDPAGFVAHLSEQTEGS